MRLQCYIKIMQVVNLLGVWELSYPCEEFADEVRMIEKSVDKGFLVGRLVKLGEWGV
jgi:hypothetical protein